MKNNHGFTLLQLLIYFCIVMIILNIGLITFFNIIHKHDLNVTAHKILKTLYYGQHLAMSTDNDIKIIIKDNILYLFIDNQIVRKIVIPASLKISLNNESLGFKAGSGNALASGSIILSNKYAKKIISLSVGYGKISLKSAVD